MGGIDVPIVAAGTPIADALEAMRRRRRLAVAIEEVSGGFRLLTCDALEIALGADASSVDEITSPVLPHASAAETVGALYDVPTGNLVAKALQASWFAAPYHRAGPRLRPNGDTLLVITAHESDADENVAEYICNGTNPPNGKAAPHEFHQLPRAGLCTKCVTPTGGAPPTVVPFL